MRESWEYCCIDIYSDYDLRWLISFRSGVGRLIDAIENGDDHKIIFCTASHEDLNEAVREAYVFYTKNKIWGRHMEIEHNLVPPS